MAFLKREYKAIGVFAIIVAILLAIGLKGQGGIILFLPPFLFW